MAAILFLDDDRNRHYAFRSCIEALGYAERFRMFYVFTAADAIEVLKEHGDVIVQCFLDHDLDERDVMSKVGEKTLMPTGMTVVDFIVRMKSPPPAVVVHSLNYDAACEMCARLGALRTVAVSRIPFSALIPQLQPLT
jgi:hypothetical protein